MKTLNTVLSLLSYIQRWVLRNSATACRHNWRDSKLQNGVPLFARAVTVSLQSPSSTDGLASLAESLFVCKLWVEMS